MKYKTWSIVVSIIIVIIGGLFMEQNSVQSAFGIVYFILAFLLILRPAYFYWVRLFNQKNK